MKFEERLKEIKELVAIGGDVRKVVPALFDLLAYIDSISTIKKQLDFNSLVTLMQKNSAFIFCGDNGEPSIEISLEKDEVPEDLEDALYKVQQEWENLKNFA